MSIVCQQLQDHLWFSKGTVNFLAERGFIKKQAFKRIDSDFQLSGHKRIQEFVNNRRGFMQAFRMGSSNSHLTTPFPDKI